MNLEAFYTTKKKKVQHTETTRTTTCKICGANVPLEHIHGHVLSHCNHDGQLFERNEERLFRFEQLKNDANISLLESCAACNKVVNKTELPPLNYYFTDFRLELIELVNKHKEKAAELRRLEKTKSEQNQARQREAILNGKV
jgi:hypothetical protein